jgi:hypothetical protein
MIFLATVGEIARPSPESRERVFVEIKLNHFGGN